MLAAVGLVLGDAHRELPPQVVSTGLPTLIAPVASVTLRERREARLRAGRRARRATYGAPNLYLVCLQDEGKARARMFTSFVEGGEDPATGSAAGPLCAYLAERGHGTRVEITQGVEMGRPSRLIAEMEDDRPRVGRQRRQGDRGRSPPLSF